MKAPASVVGNQVTPVSVAMVAWVIPAVTVAGRPVRIILDRVVAKERCKERPGRGIALMAGMSWAGTGICQGQGESSRKFLCQTDNNDGKEHPHADHKAGVHEGGHHAGSNAPLGRRDRVS